MESEQAKPSGLSVVIRLANPTFVVLAIGLPVAALIFAMSYGSLAILNYVHIMTGAMWTGIDLFMGFVLGPVLGGMEPHERATVFRRLIPKMTFLMPFLAMATLTASFALTDKLGYSFSSPRIVIALIIAGILTIQGFGILLPNEIRIFGQLISDTPDIDKISRLGMRNARLGGVQGVLQIAIIFVMAVIRF
jgi:hypothetical protein